MKVVGHAILKMIACMSYGAIGALCGTRYYNTT